MLEITSRFGASARSAAPSLTLEPIRPCAVAGAHGVDHTLDRESRDVAAAGVAVEECACGSELDDHELRATFAVVGGDALGLRMPGEDAPFLDTRQHPVALVGQGVQRVAHR